MSDTFKLTRAARRLIRKRKFPEGMSPMARLMSCIIYQTGEIGISQENCEEIAEEVLQDCDDDIELAIDAVLSGEWKLEEITERLH